MKRTVIAIAVLALVASTMSAPATAAKKPKGPKKIERTFEFEYVCPCPGLFQLGAATGGDPNLGGGVFPVGAGEIWLSAEVTDTSGQPVPVDIQQDTDGDGQNNAVGSFCGTTDAPMPINEGLEVRVFVGLPLTCPGPALGGTITFTLSNMP